MAAWVQVLKMSLHQHSGSPGKRRERVCFVRLVAPCSALATFSWHAPRHQLLLTTCALQFWHAHGGTLAPAVAHHQGHLGKWRKCTRLAAFLKGCQGGGVCD